MRKQNSILIPLLAIGVVFLLGYKGFGWENSLKDTEIANIITTLSTTDRDMREAWTTFENYLEFARAHNLSGIRSLSHQISATCNDPSREKECFALMDSVYAFASQFKLGDFKHIQSDERQVIMFTDGPTVAILYFTKDERGSLKVLGMRFCLEDETVQKKCVDTDSIKHDENNNGWWDSVESLFY
ncbi:MAG: hypothetical protein AAB782_00755 [Patescibacteria group bacterium]